MTALSDFINAISKPSWRPITRSQAASDYFHDAHAFSNTPLWQKIVKEATALNIDINEKLIRTNYQTNSIISFNLIQSIFSEHTPFVITELHISQLNKINKPKFIIVAENDNLVYTLGMNTNVAVVSGNGRAITDTIHKNFFKWAHESHIPVYYTGDLDPIGLSIAQQAVSVIQSNDVLRMYPSMPTVMGMLSSIGSDVTTVSKRFTPQTLSNKTLSAVHMAFELTNYKKFVEQEQLVDYYLTKINQIEKDVI